MANENTIEITTQHGSYQAERDALGAVRIYRADGDQWVYVGRGRWDGRSIVDCTAELVPGSADATEEVYDALDQELSQC